MTTTSGNIAGVPTPFARVPKGGAWPYSKKKIWTLDELKPKEKGKRKVPARTLPIRDKRYDKAMERKKKKPAGGLR